MYPLRICTRNNYFRVDADDRRSTCHKVNNYVRGLGSFLDPSGLGFNASDSVHRPMRPNMLIFRRLYLRTASKPRLD